MVNFIDDLQLSSLKKKYIMLSIMISGPRQPRNDIDVYFKPLVNDLKKLWETSKDVFIAYYER